MAVDDAVYEKYRRLFDVRIVMLELHHHITSAFMARGRESVGDLLGLSADDLVFLAKFSVDDVDEVRSRLTALGTALKGERRYDAVFEESLIIWNCEQQGCHREVMAKRLNQQVERLAIYESVKVPDADLAAKLAEDTEDLGLSVRAYNCLKRAGIHTVFDLVTATPESLLALRNFSQKCLDEIREKIAERSLKFLDEYDDEMRDRIILATLPGQMKDISLRLAEVADDLSHTDIG